MQKKNIQKQITCWYRGWAEANADALAKIKVQEEDGELALGSREVGLCIEIYINQ